MNDVVSGKINSIDDQPVNKECDFEIQKTIGLNYIKELSDSSWSNFNESDPGVTILEQICYALTELGYCNDFPIEDILTNQKGELDHENQFYQPEDILTTAPITLKDHSRQIVSNFNEILNAYVKPLFSKSGVSSGSYQVYLFTTNNLSDAEKKSVLNRVFAHVNSNRAIGELCTSIQILKPSDIKLAVKIELNQHQSLTEVIDDINKTLAEYVSPNMGNTQTESHSISGANVHEAYNGTKNAILQCDRHKTIGIKRTDIKLMELLSIVSSVEGVEFLEDIQFTVNTLKSNANGASLKTIKVLEDQVAYVTICTDDSVFIQNGVEIKEGGPLSVESYLSNLPRTQLSRTNKSNNSDQIQGRYREISDYYSIQNTFPRVFSVGENPLPHDASAFRKAQSIQLKGYLTLFDQMLANQFSQLENIPNLFSFRLASSNSLGNRPLTGGAVATSSLELNTPHYVEQESHSFSPSYYSQPLYNVPGVKPLLVGHDAYDYEIEGDFSVEKEEASWNKYKKDQNNQYITGLRQLMEDGETRDRRRNEFLNHILARHGQKGSEIDDLILFTRTYFEPLKSKIIVKSLYLQNLVALTYNRSKGYDYFHAATLSSPGRYHLKKGQLEKLLLAPDVINHITDFNIFCQTGYQSLPYLKEKLFNLTASISGKDNVGTIIERLEYEDGNIEHKNRINPLSKGKFDFNKIEQQEKLSDNDLINFSAYELKLNLLLGLTRHYHFVIDVLLQLLSDISFKNWVINENKTGAKYIFPDINSDIEVQRIENKEIITVSGQPLMTVNAGPEGFITLLDYQRHIDQLLWLSNQRKGLILLEANLLLKSSMLDARQLSTLGCTTKELFFQAVSIFPSYLTLAESDSFKLAINKLNKRHWPMHVRNQRVNLSYRQLSEVIPSYIGWHDGVIENSARHNYASSHAVCLIKQVLTSLRSSKASEFKGALNDK